MLMLILKLRNDFLSNIDYTDEFLKKRRLRQKKARKRRLIAWFIFFIAAMLVVGVILSLTVLFPIKKLNIEGSKIYSATQIEDASGIDLGDNLFNISKTDTLNKLKKKLPFIEEVELERQFPDALTIKVKDAKRYASFKIDDKFYTVSRDGWVLEQTAQKAENVFLVISDDVVCKVGKSIEFKTEKIKNQIDQIVEQLNNQNITIDYIDVTSSLNLSVGIEGRFDVNFGNINSLEYKVKYLKTMIEGFEDSKSGSIDLSMLNSQNSQGIFRENNTK